MSITGVERRQRIALRVPQHALADIDRQAKAKNLTRTDFIIRACTGEIEHTRSTQLDRLDAIEERLERLEQVAYE